jgi:hypothetical protein
MVVYGKGPLSLVCSSRLESWNNEAPANTRKKGEKDKRQKYLLILFRNVNEAGFLVLSLARNKINRYSLGDVLRYNLYMKLINQ